MSAPVLSVDAHAHVWMRARTPQPWIDSDEMACLDSDFGLAELRAMQSVAGVGASVLVQTANSAHETLDLLSLAGVVGWVDFAIPLTPQLGRHESAIAAERLFGIRHLIHQDPDPEWMARAEVSAGLQVLGELGLAFDLVLRPDQLAMATTLVREHPGTSFVLDHLGKLPIASGNLAKWRADLAAMAALPNVTAKLSGLTTEANWKRWTAAQLGAAVEHALDVFGPQRLMFGTYWPVALLAGTPGAWPELLSTLCGHLDADSQGAIFGTPHALSIEEMNCE